MPEDLAHRVEFRTCGDGQCRSRVAAAMVGYVLVYLAVLHPFLENDFYGGGRDPQFMINQVNSLFLFAISFDFFCIVFDVNILCIKRLCCRYKYNTNETKTRQNQQK